MRICLPVALLLAFAPTIPAMAVPTRYHVGRRVYGCVDRAATVALDGPNGESADGGWTRSVRRGGRCFPLWPALPLDVISHGAGMALVRRVPPRIGEPPLFVLERDVKVLRPPAPLPPPAIAPVPDRPAAPPATMANAAPDGALPTAGVTAAGVGGGAVSQSVATQPSTTIPDADGRQEPQNPVPVPVASLGGQSEGATPDPHAAALPPMPVPVPAPPQVPAVTMPPSRSVGIDAAAVSPAAPAPAVAPVAPLSPAAPSPVAGLGSQSGGAGPDPHAAVPPPVPAAAAVPAPPQVPAVTVPPSRSVGIDAAAISPAAPAPAVAPVPPPSPVTPSPVTPSPWPPQLNQPPSSSNRGGFLIGFVLTLLLIGAVTVALVVARRRRHFAHVEEEADWPPRSGNRVVEPRSPSPPVPTASEFRKHCAAELTHAGWATQLIFPGDGSGPDIVARRDAVVAAVRCRASNTAVTGEMVDEAAVMGTRHGATLTLLASNAPFSQLARDEATRHGIRLLRDSELGSFVG